MDTMTMQDSSNGGHLLNQVQRFLEWANKKLGIHFSERGKVHFNEREIWWASLGENVGSEANGKNFYFERPVIVFKKFSSDMMLAIPCTTKLKEGSWYYKFILHESERRAIMSQMRTISSKRLIREMGKISPEEFIALQKAVIDLIKTNPST